MAKMNLVETVKGNPVISTLAALAVVTTTITGALAAFGTLDSLVMTHAEHDVDIHRLDEQHAAESQQIEDLKLWNQCDRLERRREALEERLWRVMQDEDPDAETIRDIENDLEDIERQYRALQCAEILAG